MANVKDIRRMCSILAKGEDIKKIKCIILANGQEVQEYLYTVLWPRGKGIRKIDVQYSG